MMMMANMHEQNYRYDMQLAQHFQGISNTFTAMAQSEYQMYMQHTGQAQNMMPDTMMQPMKPVMKNSSKILGM